MEELTLSLEETLDPKSSHVIEAIINGYNSQVMQSDYRPLSILLRNACGEVVGGLLGKTEWGWLYVATLAIREEYRGRGYGTKLLAAAEAAALARGCHDAFLDTFSFQARPFYERRGYEVFGVLEQFSEHTKYFLRKKLGQGRLACHPSRKERSPSSAREGRSGRPRRRRCGSITRCGSPICGPSPRSRRRGSRSRPGRRCRSRWRRRTSAGWWT